MEDHAFAVARVPTTLAFRSRVWEAGPDSYRLAGRLTRWSRQYVAPKDDAIESLWRWSGAMANACCSPFHSDSPPPRESGTAPQTTVEKSYGNWDGGRGAQNALYQFRPQPRLSRFNTAPYRYTCRTRSLVVSAADTIMAWYNNNDTNDHVHSNAKIPKITTTGMDSMVFHNTWPRV